MTTQPGFVRHTNVVPEYLDSCDAARFLGFTHDRFRKLRELGKGPSFRRIGRVCFYAVDDLRTWMQQHPLEGGSNG